MMPEFAIVAGDLTERRVDAIVNAWNRNFIPYWLLLPRGVAGAIRRRGGREILAAVSRVGLLPLGGAVATGAGRLPARWVIHVAVLHAYWLASERSVALGAANAFRVAAEVGARTLALPLLGAGTGGLRPEVALAAIRRAWSETPVKPERTEIVVLDAAVAARLVGVEFHAPAAGAPAPAGGDAANEGPAPGVAIQVRLEPERAWPELATLAVRGSLADAARAPVRDAIEVLRGTGVRRFILELSGVTGCDTAGLGLLLNLSDYLAAEGGCLALAGPAPALARSLQSMPENPRLRRFDTVDLARAFLQWLIAGGELPARPIGLASLPPADGLQCVFRPFRRDGEIHCAMRPLAELAGGALMVLAGCLSPNTVGKFQEQLNRVRDQGYHRLIFDLRAVEEVVETALDYWILVARDLWEHGGGIALVLLGDRDRADFEWLRICALFPNHETVEQAIETLATHTLTNPATR
ncbi:MAG: macro domain-containing protein [Planctomycetes bacterium]|nr:macro domain-containing protein [Planctomycetota bacterium]